jgi:hypothetical protein
MRHRYQVEINGEVNEPHSRKDVAARLAKLFGCAPVKIEALLNGRPHTLKTGLDGPTAEKYLTAIQACGAQCALRICMDQAAYRQGLFTVDSIEAKQILATAPPAPPISSRASDRHTTVAGITYRFDTARLFPTLFHPKAQEAISVEGGSPVGEISSSKSALSYRAALFLSIAIAYFVQYHFAHQFAERVSTGITCTLISILLFFGIILLLPNRLRPLQKLTVTLKHSGENLTWMVCHETSFTMVNRKFVIESPSGCLMARMYKAPCRYQFLCRDRNGAVILSAEEEPDLEDLYLDAVTEIRDELLGFAIVEYTQMVVEFCRRMGKTLLNLRQSGWRELLFWRRPFDAKVSGRLFVMRSSDGRAQGHVVVGRMCEIQLYACGKVMVDPRILIGFGLLLAGE